MKIRSIHLDRTGFYGFLPVSAVHLRFRMVSAQDGGANPPAEPVKLVFIHHSCGENWLADGHGNLGRSLAENNYFVSDTNYGLGPFRDRRPNGHSRLAGLVSGTRPGSDTSGSLQMRAVKILPIPVCNQIRVVKTRL